MQNLLLWTGTNLDFLSYAVSTAELEYWQKAGGSLTAGVRLHRN
jgi:hypothetical protein